MVVDINIAFENNPEAIFHTGQTMYLIITLKCNETIKLREIYCKINGSAFIWWTVGRTTYHGDEKYCDVEKKMQLPERGERTFNLQPGTYSYHFKYEIPSIAASSAKGDWGHIGYVVTVVLNKPWKFNQKFTKKFKVVQVLNLNLVPRAIIPSSVLSKKTFGFSCWRSRPLYMNVQVPQSGFVPGQSIPIKITVENNSGVDVVESRAKLIMVNFSSTGKPGSKLYTDIKGVKGPGVAKRSEKVFFLNLPVPATQPTSTEPWHLIHVTYRIVVELVVESWHLNHRGKLPIMIGTVPINLNEAHLIGIMGVYTVPSNRSPHPSNNNKEENLPSKAEKSLI